MKAIRDGLLVLLFVDMHGLLEQITRDGIAAALAQVGMSDEGITEQANEFAVSYARDHAADLVGKKWVDGELVDNPKAQWRIDEATRDLIRADVTKAVDEGWSNDRLAEALGENYAFSASRAETIARTETAFADVAGNIHAWKLSGQVESKQWIVGDGCCDDCQELDGTTVALDQDFPDGGGAGPPLHPNCRCDVVPVLTEDAK